MKILECAPSPLCTSTLATAFHSHHHPQARRRLQAEDEWCVAWNCAASVASRLEASEALRDLASAPAVDPCEKHARAEE